MDGILEPMKYSNIGLYVLYRSPVKKFNETNDQKKDHGSQYSSFLGNLYQVASPAIFWKDQLPGVIDVFDKQGKGQRHGVESAVCEAYF